MMRVLALVVLLVALLCGGGLADEVKTEGAGAVVKQEEAAEKPLKKVDFPLRNNMGGDCGKFELSKDWCETDFGGSGGVRVEEGVAYLDEGNDMTGVTWRGPIVRMDYEITLDAKRVAGDDFFCGLTFPYGPDPCSLIVGGWGGTVVGLSSLDYSDAYNNETARFVNFDKGRWYRIRLRVTKKKIEAWIDDRKLVDVKTEGRKIGIRWEVEKSCPLGIATWRTSGALRDVQFRVFSKEEVREIGEEQAGGEKGEDE